MGAWKLIKIYQDYYMEEQKTLLDPAFIYYNNMENLTPQLREYPIIKDLFQRHRGSNDLWGAVSSRWYEKTRIVGHEFKQWIVDNPGYDCYHIDPYPENLMHQNPWVQGEQWHEGMVDFANKLFPMIGLYTRCESLVLKADDFATTGYYVGNTKFWTEWMLFLDSTLVLCSQHSDLYSYLYLKGGIYNGTGIINFPFVVERLRCIFYILHREIKVKKFPIEHPSFTDRYGKDIIRFYHERNK